MPKLNLVFAPDPIFRQKAVPVVTVTDETRALVDAMFDVLYREQGVGLGANMVGLLHRIVVIDLQETGDKTPLTLIDPERIKASEETQVFTEASLSFPGISAEITRPRAITVTYLDYDGNPRELEAEGWLAQVIQHEMDYLDGRTYLDHLSSLKRSRLLKKMQKTGRR